jgi:hypothetical protein
MTPREIEEYKALRDTIRERGTTRVWVVLAGIIGWASLMIATAALAALPVTTLLPLLVLATAFEIVFALHTSVERIGRYIQVFFEGVDARGWEHAAMAYGKTFGGGSDPLFANFFRVATIVNFTPAVYANPRPVEWGVVGSLHLLFIVRMIIATRDAGRQRALDLERFQTLKNQLKGELSA